MTTDALKSDGCPWGRCVRAAGHTGGCMASNGDLLSRQFSESRNSPSGAERLLPSENGGPECNHVLWVMGCRPCADWAVANGVAFAQHMTSRQPEPSYTLVGAELVAYARLRAAALQAHAAQQAAAAAGQELREALQAWGAVVAPGKES